MSPATAGSPRWLLLREPGASLSAAPEDPANALRLLAQGQGLGVLMDRASGQADLALGEGATSPVFLVREADGGLALVRGVAALRGLAVRPVPSSIGVAHMLGFGHAPPGQPMLDGVWPLLAGEARTVVRSVPLAPRRLLNRPLPDTGALPTTLRDRLAAAVHGRAVVLAATASGPATVLLRAACLAAGASRVKLVGTDGLPPSLGPFQSIATVLSGLPLADPNLLADAAASLTAVPHADVLLLDWGSESWLPARPAHWRFADALARPDAAKSRNVAGGYLSFGSFARDLLFTEICAFSDEERYRAIGPALLADGFFSMADELGTRIEDAAPDQAAALAGRLDPALRPGGSAAALRLVLAAVAGRPVLAPFLDSEPPVTLPAVLDVKLREELDLRAADIVPDRLTHTLGPKAQIFVSGLLAPTPPVVGLLAQGETGLPRARRQALVLLALEKWLRATGA